jgi:hypothetical protein
MQKVVVFLAGLSTASAQEASKNTSYALVDIMNALLIVICCVFVFAIVGTLRNKKLLDLVRSAHFFRIKNIITAWTLLGSAILLFALTELIYAFGILDNYVEVYKLFKTLFGVLFAAGLFLQYMVLQKYVKHYLNKKKSKPSDGA